MTRAVAPHAFQTTLDGQPPDLADMVTSDNTLDQLHSISIN